MSRSISRRVATLLLLVLTLGLSEAPAQDLFKQYVDRVQWNEANQLAREEIQKDPGNLEARRRYLIVVKGAARAHPDPPAERRRIILETIAQFESENVTPFIDAALEDVTTDIKVRLENDDIKTVWGLMILGGALREAPPRRSAAVKAAYANTLRPPQDLAEIDVSLVRLGLAELARTSAQKGYESSSLARLEDLVISFATTSWSSNPKSSEVGLWPEMGAVVLKRLRAGFGGRGTELGLAERYTFTNSVLFLAALIPDEAGPVKMESSTRLRTRDDIPRFDLQSIRKDNVVVRRAIGVIARTPELADSGVLLALNELLLASGDQTPSEAENHLNLLVHCLQPVDATLAAVDPDRLEAHSRSVDAAETIVAFIQVECPRTTEKLAIDGDLATIHVFLAREKRNLVRTQEIIRQLRAKDMNSTRDTPLLTELDQLAKDHLDSRWAEVVQTARKEERQTQPTFSRPTQKARAANALVDRLESFAGGEQPNSRLEEVRKALERIRTTLPK